jgi:predicted O-methyltransferase YrrM
VARSVRDVNRALGHGIDALLVPVSAPPVISRHLEAMSFHSREQQRGQKETDDMIGSELAGLRTVPSIEDVSRAVGDVPFMTPDQARQLEALWMQAPVGDILELGFAHGRGSAYLGALASMKGVRAVCIDNATARDRSPSAEETIRRAGVEPHVELVYAETGYNWWLMRQLESSQRARFSLVYLDGAHEWDPDALAFLLVSGLVHPGGYLVLDDLDWTFASSRSSGIVERRKTLPADYVNEAHVRKVWTLLVQRDPTWGDLREIDSWAIARKLAFGERRAGVERVVVKQSVPDFARKLRSIVRRRFNR